MFAEKYGEVVLLSHGLSLFPTDAGVESSPVSFLSIGPRTSRRERSCAFAPEHFSQLPFIHYSPQLWRCKKKKSISLPIMVFLACLHTLALVPSPPPDLVRAVLKWLPAPCCFTSATFSRCGRITMGVRRRFDAHTLSEWACHTWLAAEGRVNRSERAPVYQSVQWRSRAALHCGATKADKVSHPKGYCCVNFCWTAVTATGVTLFFKIAPTVRKWCNIRI